MDSVEKETLKKKDFLLNHYMQWNETLKNALLTEHVISLEQASLIDKKHDSAAKTRVLLDRLKYKGRSGDLQKLSNILIETCPSFKPEWNNRWLADEIQEEIRDQQCEVIVSEDVTREVGIIIHRHFGNGTRLSEADKRVLILQLCLQTQKSLNVWKKQFQRFQEEIQYEKELRDYKDEYISAITESLDKYYEANHDRLPARKKTYDRRTSRSHFSVMPEEISKLSAADSLRKARNQVKDIIGASLLSVETLDVERQKVIKTFDLEKKDAKQRVKLDSEIQRILEERQAAITRADQDILGLENTYQKLLEELQNTKVEYAKKQQSREKNVGILLSEVHRVKDKAISHNQDVIEMKKKLRAAKAELASWNERLEHIERGERINHIYRRDERLLAKAGIKVVESEKQKEANNYFKEFDEYENKLLMMKRTSGQQQREKVSTPIGLPYTETGKPIARIKEEDSRFSQSHIVLPAIDKTNELSEESCDTGADTVIIVQRKKGRKANTKPAFR